MLAQPVTNPTPQPIPKPQPIVNSAAVPVKRNNAIWWVLGGCGLLFLVLPIIAVVAIIAVNPAQKIKEAQERAAKNATSSANTTTDSGEQDETTGWKTYTSPCGFSLKYPAGYSASGPQTTCGSGHHTDGSIASSDQGRSFTANIYVDSSPESASFDEEIDAYVGWSKEVQEKTKVQGAEAVKLKFVENEQAGSEGGKSAGILIYKSGKFFHFAVTGDDTSIANWEKMLATFKFL